MNEMSTFIVNHFQKSIDFIEVIHQWDLFTKEK